VERFTAALGPAVATPEFIADGSGGQRLATFRVWRWDCPCCRAGERDQLGIYRPFAVDADGEVWCGACNPSPEAVKREIQVRLDVHRPLEALEATA